MIGVPSAANVSDAEPVTRAVTVSSPPARPTPWLGGTNNSDSNTGTITQDDVIDKQNAWLPHSGSRTWRDHQPVFV
jgi:hypothetical protein